MKKIIVLILLFSVPCFASTHKLTDKQQIDIKNKAENIAKGVMQLRQKGISQAYLTKSLLNIIVKDNPDIEKTLEYQIVQDIIKDAYKVPIAWTNEIDKALIVLKFSGKWRVKSLSYY